MGKDSSSEGEEEEESSDIDEGSDTDEAGHIDEGSNEGDIYEGCWCSCCTSKEEGGVVEDKGGTVVDFTKGNYEINLEQAREEFRASVTKDGGSGVKDFMDSVGLGGWVGELSELKLGELLDIPPPGLDQAITMSKVVQFMQAPEYSKFSRIIFDNAPTGHTMRLLSLPDFLYASIDKILKLKKKIQSAASAIKSGQGDGPNKATDKLEALKERMIMVRQIFRNKETTEFVIVMAISESSRLKSSLEKEGVPVKRLIVNQVLPPSNVDCKFCVVKRKDQ